MDGWMAFFLCLPAQSHGGDSRREAAILRELDMAIEGQWDWYLMSTARALKRDLLQSTGVNVCDKTIRHRLHEGGQRA